ncbi:VOC family protein [Streptomyces sp. RKND-216]|uniref:VOC family protein n=1 Tax=Streptomyces sp. RKND-216 TaxID=2562581 RepID=UPI00109DA435|nr:VOC family protein [Streptomyces sp. RKND-216]THA23679.1 VOC family protein [Streptomyces sp. RKND-216]
MRGRRVAAPGAPRAARADYWGPVLECPDPHALARFYAELLGWELAKEDTDGAALIPPDGVAYLGFQHAPGYVRPVWPAREGEPHITMHLDFEVSDLGAAVAHALALGAEPAFHQPQPNVRVLLDPAGHPFCLYVDV